jgi:lipoprotein-anchoring transpeptidase ErfK/SrfK
MKEKETGNLGPADEQETPLNGEPLRETVNNKPVSVFLPFDTLDIRKIRFVARKILIVLTSIVSILFLFTLFIYLIPSVSELTPLKRKHPVNSSELKKDASYKKQAGIITRDVQRLLRKYNSYTTGQSYIVINTTYNRFSLYRNKKKIREGFCSSGSYTLLQSHGTRYWIFKTPKGKYWIQGKTKYPVWRRPDWAFVEEGLPVPPPEDPSRYEYGVLGDYAMSIGDGYLIHGTIYKRFLGMPVTHGCVRLNDEDLEVIFNTLSIGSKVYIF